VISERFEQRIAAALGDPDRDPHGDPIPSSSGAMDRSRHPALTECAAGERVVVRRVSDRDPDKLRAIRELGLEPGVEVEVVAESRYEGPITVRIGRSRVAVPLGLARVTFVGPA
jgi:DtxR family Mn-dependent transcriptional regulator